MKKLCMVLAILVFSSCFGKTDIVGKWKVLDPPFDKLKPAEENTLFVYYVFSKDKSFIVFIPTFNPVKGTYSITEDILILKFDDKEGSQTYDISYSSSNELIVKRKEDGYVMRMTR